MLRGSGAVVLTLVLAHSAAAQPDATRAYRRSAAATARIELLGGKFALYVNPAKWSETRSDPNGNRSFTHTKGDAFAALLVERSEYSFDFMRTLAVRNAQAAASD